MTKAVGGKLNTKQIDMRKLTLRYFCDSLIRSSVCINSHLNISLFNIAAKNIYCGCRIKLHLLISMPLSKLLLAKIFRLKPGDI